MLPVAVTYMYAKYYFTNETRSELRDFVRHLKASMTLALQQNEWMDDETKLRAQLKLNKMLDYIATPTWIANDDDLDEFYSDVSFNKSNISPDNYIRSFIKLSQRKRLRKLNSLRGSWAEENLVFEPTVINAYYVIMSNKFGILQNPFYYVSSPIAMNFGAIGMVIGHEIMHGFDDMGSSYDEKGKYTDWWNVETRKKYEERVNCFKNQYSQVTEPVTGKKVNGTLTIGDNLADNVGIQLAYTAYKLYTATKERKMDVKLPKSMQKYTKEQLFFISFGNLWCNNDSKEHILEQLSTDPHSPHRIRAIISVSNFEQFAKTFQCKEGSKMNPKKRCSIW
ncbi:hypothetical protein B4U80_04829 [Leptotrombidium deliense]|uniref:Uncharacterized protein n=1 Tax=Leptotrombidium deliense TaxID=299467 RepID=A0A443RYP4_9ACAR|nr:hypothetical protein B4U80_04829 [Leptotrombidium deliense]